MRYRKMLMTIGCSFVLFAGAVGAGQVLGDDHAGPRRETPTEAALVDGPATPMGAPVPPVCPLPGDLAATLDAVFAASDVPNGLAGATVADALSQQDPCMVVALVQDLLTCDSDEACRRLLDVVRDLVDGVTERIGETVSDAADLVEAVDVEVDEVLDDVPSVPAPPIPDSASAVSAPVASALEAEADLPARPAVPDPVTPMPVLEERPSAAHREAPVPAPKGQGGAIAPTGAPLA